jgi:mTERF domain-containing protein
MATIHYDSELPVGSSLPDYILREDRSDALRRPRTKTTGAKPTDGEDASSSSNLLDYQTRELQRYRDAMRKLGQDVLGLRQQVRNLEAENARLRRELNQSTDADSGSSYRRVDSRPVEEWTKGELANRYSNLKVRFDRQTDELRDYRDRIQKLQNDLLRKNDLEIQGLVLSGGWSGTNQELRRQLDEEVQRSRTLEATRSRQAIVIADLEKELANMRMARYDDSANLSEANMKLRLEVTRLKDELDMRPARDLPHEIEWANRLQASEARIRGLEQQLAEEAHRWNLERADLLAELRDAKSRWIPVYNPGPQPLPHIARKASASSHLKSDDVKPPWRPHHGKLNERLRKEKRLYRSPRE